MEQIQDLLLDTDQRAAAVAKLFRLIEMDTEIIGQYRANGIDDAQMQQYVDLRNQNLKQLADLLHTPKLNIQLSFDKAA
ncbi:MAG: hypothetical protein EAZ32_18820 [Cytophagia bacterium]|nr:MAG: hypothetical protein EAZ32_18820 [Cytophagia bacterium]